MKTRLILLLALGALLSPSLSSANPAEELWMKHCKKCHGPGGKGDTPMGKKFGARDLSDPAVQAEFSDEAIRDVIINGKKDDSGRLLMLAFGNKLSGEQVDSLVAYCRSLQQE
ncbi:MAG: c-type cytochrome [Oceanipulchritudo sp.]